MSDLVTANQPAFMMEQVFMMTVNSNTLLRKLADNQATTIGKIQQFLVNEAMNYEGTIMSKLA